MVSALFYALNDQIGVSLFLLVSILSFISLYFLIMKGRSNDYRWLKYAVVSVSIVLSDGTWLANRFLETVHFSSYTTAEKLFVDFSCAGVLFFIAVAFISLFSAKKFLRFRIAVWIVLVAASLWNLLNRFASAVQKTPFCIFGLSELETSLVLGFVIIASIGALGYISSRFDGLTVSQKSLAIILAAIIVVMAIMYVGLILRDLKIFEAFIRGLIEFSAQ